MSKMLALIFGLQQTYSCRQFLSKLSAVFVSLLIIREFSFILPTFLYTGIWIFSLYYASCLYVGRLRARGFQFCWITFFICGGTAMGGSLSLLSSPDYSPWVAFSPFYLFTLLVAVELE